jgi:hypothetical protein
MKIIAPVPRPDRRLLALVATVALHLALVWVCKATQQRAPQADEPREAIEWVNIALPRPAKAQPEPRQVTRAKPQAEPRSGKRNTVPAATPAAAETAIALLPEPAAPAAPARTAEEMLQQARRDIGKFDKELRKEFAGKGIRAPVSSPQMRLARGMEDAHDAVPPKWYQAAKIKEIIDPGGYGRRRYRVTTAFGTHCMTVESHHSPGAQLDVGKRVEPKVTNCDDDEQAPTEQKW